MGVHDRDVLPLLGSRLRLNFRAIVLVSLHSGIGERSMRIDRAGRSWTCAVGRISVAGRV